MKNELEAKINKNGKIINRKLNNDKIIINPEGKKIYLKARSLLLIRNVGHLMKNNSVILNNEKEIPEGILDAFISVLCSVHDLKNKNNSKQGSIYIVKPKMHGPKEVEFANKVFSKVEEILQLKLNTIKIGIMDEEKEEQL